MKTDITAEEQVKETRKRLFWRLWVLPWLLLVLGLAGFSLYLVHEYKALQGQRGDSSVDYQKGLQNGMEIVHKEAVGKGYASWAVDPETLKVIFTWKDITAKVYTNESIKVYTNESERVYIKREYPFTYTDLEWADSIGMDLERDIIGTVRFSIHGIMTTADMNMSRLELEKLLKEQTEVEIRKRFDGFETYKKTK